MDFVNELILSKDDKSNTVGLDLYRRYSGERTFNDIAERTTVKYFEFYLSPTGQELIAGRKEKSYWKEGADFKTLSDKVSVALFADVHDVITALPADAVDVVAIGQAVPVQEEIVP